MYTIAGAAGKDAHIQIKKMLEVIKHRGADGAGIYYDGNIAMCNAAIKINGEETHPISNNCGLVYNGNIYNLKEIAQAQNIITDSDSETLFTLIRSKGIEPSIMELDGDYAFAYIERETLYLVRDPAGVKPLYYACGDIFAFASEKKILGAIGLQDIFSLRPGHMLIYTAGKVIEKKVSSLLSGELIDDEKKASVLLLNTIKQAVRKRNFSPFAIAFSGGLDSSVLAALCSNAKLYSVGMAGSHDIDQTRKAAQLLGRMHDLHLNELTMEKLETAIPDVINAIESADPQAVSIALPLYFASKDAHFDGIRVMLSGQGADELFGGYKRYESMNSYELDHALRNDLDTIAMNNLERDYAITTANSVELRLPYLDQKVIELALRIIPDLKINNRIRKYILRLAAKNILPDELVWKEKKAAQYSSGIYSAMKKLARKNGYTGKRSLGRYLGECLKKDQ